MEKEPIKEKPIRFVSLYQLKNNNDTEQEIISKINYGFKLSKELNIDVKKDSKEVYPHLTKLMTLLSYGDLVGASDEITGLPIEYLSQTLKDKYLLLLNLSFK